MLAAAEGIDGPTAVMCVLAALVGAACIVWGAAERKKRLRAEAQLMSQQVKAAARPEGGDERGAAFADQHRRLNDLQILKLTAEVELLQAQLRASASHPDRIDAGKEAHELMVEKTRLEIDGLRLHIAEQRKRMEDWRVDND